jgi:NADPH-dependent curcumin reductase CurA
MSVDPHMRIFMGIEIGARPAFQLDKAIDGGCVGQVVDSRSNKFNVGDYVLGNSGWREYWISNDDTGQNNNNITKIDPTLAPIQYFLGILGITGFTAYLGLFKIDELKEGTDIVFVSAAAGGVGSVACQIARIKGCHTVGSAGSEDKIKWLLDELKVDYAFNYKKLGENNISVELKKACPNGIDLYFDNVSGKHLESAIDNMNPFGRIVLCGATSQYNNYSRAASDNNSSSFESRQAIGPLNLSLAILKRLRLQGFIFSDHYNLLNEFYTSMSKWINEGRIKWKETVYEGLENAPKAFIDLFKGENIGRTLVKIRTRTLNGD